MATSVRACFLPFLLIILGLTEKVVSLGRQKEVGELTALKFPTGASLTMTVALANHFPKGPLTDGLNQILEFDFGFPFPDKAAYNTKPVATPLRKASKYSKNTFTPYKRQKRSSKETEQQNLLSRLENVVTRLGYDGMACISRFQCELTKISPESSLIEELLVALFKISTRADGDGSGCDSFISDCPLSILHILLHSQYSKGDE